MTTPPRKPTPKPWSMKWPIIAIIVFVIGYTLVNVYFRKPGAAYRPYQDSQDRATVARLLAAGWHKHPVEVRRPTESAPIEGPQAKLERGSPGLGLTFDENFAEKPKLLATIDRATAPSSVDRGDIYGVYFTGAVSDLKTELGALTLYRRSNELVLVPTVEPLPGDNLLSRWNDSNYAFGFPTADLDPGTYQIRIVAHGPAIAWTFTVR